MNFKRSTIDQARDALNEVYGAVPHSQRGHVDDAVRIVEHALTGYAEALSSLREIESKLYHSGKAQERVATQINTLFEG